ncbi:MAG: TIGR01777 family oxidoreductase [Steroidobacteraceae bacterium]
MRILMTGASGFIGRHLCPVLAAGGHEVIAWVQTSPLDRLHGVQQVVRSLMEVKGEVDAVVNLAGASIAGGRWTAKRKAVLLESRIDTTRRLIDWMDAVAPPRVLVSSSAVGWYGDLADRWITEEGVPGQGFSAELCQRWEQVALEARTLGTRVALVRTGVVLGADGGALASMLPAFRFGLGGPLGGGAQYFPWIHVNDIVGIYRWLIESSGLEGPFNAAAPNPVTQAQFARTLGQVLGRPAIMNLPAWLLRILLGEMSELLLTSSRMMPGRLLETGFRFRHPELRPALESLLRNGRTAD